jgi:hypothetical protein
MQTKMGLVKRCTALSDVCFTPKADIHDTTYRALGSPKVFETRWRQLGVAYGVLDAL